MEAMDDCMVPSLEDLEENPLIKDSFIGVTDPVLKWPPGVEFVEADGSASIEASDFYYHSQQQQQQLSYVQSASTYGRRQRQESFNLGQLLTGVDAGQQPPLQSFLQQKNLADNLDGSQYQQQQQQQSFVDSGAGASGGSFEMGWLENKTDLTLLSGWIGDAATIDFAEGVAVKEQRQIVPAVVEDEAVPEKDQILQEIVRECEEIERRSSPGSDYPSSVSSPSNSTSPLNSVASSPQFTWTARPVATFAFKRQQPTTITLEQASTALQPKDVKARSKTVQKEKKKAQNREAATRYREKKRLEREGVRGELSTLESRNMELKTQVDDIQYEIDYLRGLMREIGLAK
uniref:BZIP domain-containing protein n=1 Tax=Plectus sambesii TaxID=2011161 RepID=A0A914WFG0_9BILA